MSKTNHDEHRIVERSIDEHWIVYLLECSDNTLYCGITTNLARRVRQHNGELVGGARYTRCRRPVSVVAYAACASRSAALKLEYAVRRCPPDQKKAFLRARHGVEGA